MTDEVDYLRSISRPPREFDAANFVDRVIAEEVKHMRNLAHQGLFHNHVRLHGYPLPDELVVRSGYSPRKRLEKELREAITKKENVILLGCEGSGKTTLIHYIAGRHPHFDLHTFIYLDVSDFDIPTISDFVDQFYDKLRNALFGAVKEPQRSEFEQWLNRAKEASGASPFAMAALDISTRKGFVEVLVAYLQFSSPDRCFYIIVDNIDSISVPSTTTLFNAINALDQSARRIAHEVGLSDNDNVRYIITCRATTYGHVQGAAKGLFLQFAPREVNFDERFDKDTSPITILEDYIKKEYILLYDQYRRRRLSVNIVFGEHTIDFETYIDEWFRWLNKSRHIFNTTIMKFSGQSIRRMKIYGLKVLASAFVARLVVFERWDVVSITRTEKGYLARRLQEALFDFSSGLRPGFQRYPLNPFHVVDDPAEYMLNPLIGVAAIAFIKDHFARISRHDVYYSHAICSTELVAFLQCVGYSDIAIRSFFSRARDAGFLRPVASTPVVLADATAGNEVHEIYVADDNALQFYHSLIFCHDARSSMVFYNSVVRAYYGISSDRVIDDLIYESFCCLLFLRDLMNRENRLAETMHRRGMSIDRLSAHIRGIIIPHIENLLRTPIQSEPHNRRPADWDTLPSRKELRERTRVLFDSVRDRIGKHAGF